MKKLLLITGAALAFGTVGVSSAAALAAPGKNVGTLPGFYVGLGAGIGGMNTPKLTADDLTAAGVNESTYKRRKGVAARGYLGYLWAISQVQNLQLGAELGYNYYPKNKYTLGPAGAQDAWNYKGWNADLLAVGKYNFGDTGFNLIGKVGAAYVKQKLTLNGGNYLVNPVTGANTYSKSKSKVKPEAAIGVGYDINKNIDINVIYAHVFGNKPSTLRANTPESDYTKVAPVDTILLTAAYHFGNVGGLV